MAALARRVGWILGGLVAVLLAATLLTAHPGNSALWPPAAGSPVVEIYIVNHGYHSGVVLPRTSLADVAGPRGNAALIAVAQRFGAYPWIEFGWGDEGFYSSVPDVGSLTIGLALRALFRPGNASVLHVVGLGQAPRAVFPVADIIRVELSADGFGHLLDRLDASFTQTGNPAVPEALGPGLYGPSLFFRAMESFHIFNVCNHWVGTLLSAAGLPVAPVLATLPQGLFLDLRWRSGLIPVPHPVR